MKFLAPTLSLLCVCGVGTAQSNGEQAKREAAFQELMSGCKMVGSFTVKGSDNDRSREESYTIKKIKKLRGDNWRFDAKIEYGGRTFTLPVVVQVRWAGDTPMIQVTKVPFPMMGTYSARVLIYENQYAGTWSGKNYGGHMFGKIERLKAGEAEEPRRRGKRRRVVDARPGQPTGGWPNWRGPLGSGVAPASANPPLEWSEDKNIRWKIRTPGVGISSPILWNDRIYMTTAIRTEKGGAAAPQPERERPNRGMRGRRRGRRRRSAPTKVHEFAVVALDAKNGETVWKRVVKEVVPHESGHPTGSQASASPLTDGERIYAFFGSRGMYCLDMKGEVVWSKDLGKMRTRNQFGEGASPALHGNTLVINWDHEDDSWVAAFDKKTGDEIWRKKRDEPTSWATPFIVDVGGKPQAIIPATNASRGYDLATGDEIWRLSGMTTNVIPTPAYRDGVVYLMSGYRGAMLQAVRLQGAKGDLEDSANVLWKHGSGTSYVPSSLLYGDNIYFVRGYTGVLSCLDVKTGKPRFEPQRLPGVRQLYASPVGAKGRVYFTSRKGLTVVLKQGPEYEVLASNQLDDEVDASLAVVGDTIYLRGRKNLYCIGRTAQ